MESVVFGVIQKGLDLTDVRRNRGADMKYKIARRQAGVVLMEVLPMLTLLAITGVAFVVYSTTGR